MVMKATLHYCVYHCDRECECGSLAAAMRMAEYGEAANEMSAEKIVREDVYPGYLGLGWSSLPRL